MSIQRAVIARLLLTTAMICGVGCPGLAQSPETTKLIENLTPLMDCLSGKTDEFELIVDVTVPIDGEPQNIKLQLIRIADSNYAFSASHPDYSMGLVRTGNTTSLLLPHHQVAYHGQGEVTGEDHLEFSGFIRRAVSSDSKISPYVSLLQTADLPSMIAVVTALVETQFDTEQQQWTFDHHTTVKFESDGHAIHVSDGKVAVRISIDTELESEQRELNIPDKFVSQQIARAEIERTVVRGLRRATEILAPGAVLSSPKPASRVASHGEIRWIEGHRVCLLKGSPEEIGASHGQLLKNEANKTIDSVLYTFGLVNTIRTGRWFREDLDAAYTSLAPHIPEDHKRETAAMAAALGIEEQLAQTLNVFPELFHCSGFAVFGNATTDGTLYHGRVLDYMTTIGLQDAATTFIVAVDGKIPFVNVGYAGFIGSVTGMNARSISLGEMGGRGEGQWDGVPMATLMRRALEECATLDEVKTLWTDNPRTCEYYYVFADGKTNEAVGVAATPKSIQFVYPGEAHELLGEGIEDAVVLSAGKRLETLRERVQSKHGQIDEQTAIWLMSRPVAMESNLHNALFVPAKGILYVANADHKHPAAERPYVRLDLNELLRLMSDENMKVQGLKISQE